MKSLITIILLFFTAMVFAQDRNVYFFKNDETRVNHRDSADYIRVVTPPDSNSTLFNVTEIYPDGKKKRVGKSKTGISFSPQGQVVSYYPNGNKKAIENFSESLLSGEIYEYYPNGSLKIVKEYYYRDASDNTNSHTNYRIITYNDSAGKSLIKNANGYYIGDDDLSYQSRFKKVQVEGNIKNGRREGEWKGHDTQSPMTFVELYRSGVLKSGTSTDAQSVKHKYNTRSVAPQFPGGLKGITNFLQKNIKYPPELNESSLAGRVFLSFIVSSDGSLKDAKVIRSPHELCSREALRAIAKSPLWIPGSYYGIPIDMRYNIPIAFAFPQ